MTDKEKIAREQLLRADKAKAHLQEIAPGALPLQEQAVYHVALRALTRLCGVLVERVARVQKGGV